MGSPPASRTAAASARPFESTSSPGPGTLPGGTSSSPVGRIATLGRRRTTSSARPIPAASPTAPGSTTVPAAIATAPAARSEPRARTKRPGSAARRNTAALPARRTSSCISTASAPSGSGAPVKIRQQLPGGSAAAAGRPAYTSNAIGRRAPARRASAARSA
ncbi:hypothetical protein PSR1_04536 [Anaeromyxobacter sp. PSR-1]|nr:hypothetical protein PSR1_04536 [Anaeromyxobacter sp. PSR-1]